ncbi:hypothetical protein FRB98_008641 [Tulasnella sp. 332]|nr:hypothetical protein FRB98_008641 [Tulasnella sp. 332]
MAVNHLAPGHRLQLDNLYKYATALLARFELKRGVADLGHAIALLEELADAQPTDHPLRPLTLKTLAEAHYMRSKSSGDISDLNATILYEQQVSDFYSADGPEHDLSCSRLAVALVRRSRATNSIPDLDRATNLYEKVLEGRSAKHSERSATLTGLAEALHFRYSLTKDPADRDRIYACDKEVQDLCSSDQPHQSLNLQSPATKSRFVLLRVQSLDHSSVLIEANIEDTVDQLKDMVLDKTGGSKGRHELFCNGHLLLNERTIEQCIPDRGDVIYMVYTVEVPVTQTDLIPETQSATSIPSPVEVTPILDVASDEQVGHITDSLNGTTEDEIIELATPGVASENATKIKLLDMGFSEEDIMLAMAVTRSDFEAVFGYLLNGVPADLKAEVLAVMTGESDSEMSELGTSSGEMVHFKGRRSYAPASSTTGDAREAENMSSQMEHELTPPKDSKRLANLNNLAIASINHYTQSEDLSDLDSAIGYFQEALELCPLGHFERPNGLSNLANALTTRCKQTGDREDLDAAIGYLQEEMQLYPPEDPNRPVNLNNLASALVTRYCHDGDRSGLDVAIGYFRQALEFYPPGRPGRANSLINLASALSTRCRLTGDREDLDTAVGYLQEAVQLHPPGHPHRSASLNNLANAIQARYNRDGDRADLDIAIGYHKEGLELHPLGHPNRSGSLNNLATVIQTRYKQDGNRTDLDMAIEYLQEALQLRPLGHPDRSSSLNNLAAALEIRHREDGERVDLDMAIEHHEEALQLRPLGHPDRSASLNNLANVFDTRHSQNGDREDLDTAIGYLQEAVQLRPPGHPDRLSSLNNLANVIRTRYIQDGSRADLDTAIEYYQEVLQHHPVGHPNRSIGLNNLAAAIQTRYKLDGDRADLDMAITYHQEALQLRPPEHPDRSTSLYNLANAFETRYSRNGDQVDADTAIGYYQEAIQLQPLGHLDRSASLNSLASIIHTRYMRNGDHRDLDMAIGYVQQAMHIHLAKHTDRSATINNLAHLIQTRYSRDGDRADLDIAIGYYQEALRLHPLGHPNRSVSLNNLAAIIQTRYRQDRDRADLDIAIEYDEEALQLRPLGHPERSASLNNLAIDMENRYKEDGISGDLDAAIAYHQEALRLQAPGHPNRSTSLNNLATTIHTRYGRDDDQADLDTAMLLLEEACSHEHGTLASRFDASLSWKQLALQHAHPSALNALSTALELLDMWVTMSSSLDSQHSRIVAGEMYGHVQSLASDAAAVALDSKQPQRAVELLEQGRGILFAQLIRYRTALDDLSAASPRLAAEFTTLGSRLENSVKQDHTSRSSGSQSISGSDEIGRHQELTRQWSDVVSQIRMVPGFATFLKPTPFDALRCAADEGPVIIINVSKLRSDVIILRDDAEPEIVRLADITPIEVLKIYARLVNILSEPTSELRESGVDEILRLLWELVVQPAVERLKMMGVPQGSRIWWCPTSWLCLLPLHAAGIYRPRQPKLPDMYISSYTTTLSALIRARKSDSGYIGQPSVLAVGVSQPEGRDGEDGFLPCVGEELRRLAALVPNVMLMKDQDALHDAVTARLPTHSWVHLSCHGHQDVHWPFQSRFRLQDRPLTIQEITRTDLPKAEFAFLAACHTATGDAWTPDEGLHLAAAMQFAGFRGVIGTLWAMNDSDGPDITETFYKFMFRDGEGAVDYKDAAKGIYKISTALRKKNVPLDRWINFIHVGA